MNGDNFIQSKRKNQNLAAIRPATRLSKPVCISFFSHAGVMRSIEYINQNFPDPLQSSELATASGMSPRGFIKAFYKHVGETPGAMLRRLRIDYAKRLLTEEDLPLKAVARKVGFVSENTFCVAFQRATGLSPKKFQRQIWLENFRIIRRQPAIANISIRD